MMKAVIGTALMTCLLAGSAWAASTEVRKTLEAVNACSAEPDPAKRLACYDGAGPRVRSALNIATEEDQFSLFGLFESGSSSTREATRPEDFGNRVPEDGVQVVESGGVITEITVSLADVAKNGAGKDVYVLDNGQVWRAKEAQGLRLPSDSKGIKVNIRQGMMGAYFIKREGSNKSIPVRARKVTRLPG
ncbi:MAG: hypothetical protein QM698_06835 [Micropepsaceae bacterium]